MVLWGSWSYSPLPRPSMSKHEWVQSKIVPGFNIHTHVFFFCCCFLPLSFRFPSDAQVPSPPHDWPSLTSGNHRDPTGKRWRVWEHEEDFKNVYPTAINSLNLRMKTPSTSPPLYTLKTSQNMFTKYFTGGGVRKKKGLLHGDFFDFLI